MRSEAVSIDHIKIVSNRPLNGHHVKSLAKSISEQGLMITVVINNDYEVLDGQHRVEAVKTLGWKEIYCVKVNKGSYVIAACNSSAKRWSALDYIKLHQEKKEGNYPLVTS